MNLGFIGTGKIASSVITGICTSKISFNKIIISPRNKKIAKNLKQKFKKVIIAKNNQQIVDKCDWVFLSVTPTVGDKIIKELIKSLPSFLSDDEFSATVDKIKSPNGTTEAGLNSLVNDSFDKIIYNAINSATKKSQEISQEINND